MNISRKWQMAENINVTGHKPPGINILGRPKNGLYEQTNEAIGGTTSCLPEWGSGCIDPHFLDLGNSWS
jgi:hypothetical protein